MSNLLGLEEETANAPLETDREDLKADERRGELVLLDRRTFPF